MKRVGIYVRSCNDSSNRVQSQTAQLQEYAKEHDGTVVRVYCDIGYVGREKRRLELEKLIVDCKNGNLDEVLILRASHLSRKADEFRRLYRQIAESNVKLNIIENPIDDKTIALLKAFDEILNKTD